MMLWWHTCQCSYMLSLKGKVKFGKKTRQSLREERTLETQVWESLKMWLISNKVSYTI